MKCEAKGCKNEATTKVIPTFNAPVMVMCDSCKPDKKNRPAFMKDWPIFYKVEKLTNA